MKQSNRVMHYFNSYKLLTLALTFSIASCYFPPKELPPASPEEAKAARDIFNAAVFERKTQSKQITDVIRRFNQVAIVSKIVDEPPANIRLSHEAATLHPDLGTFEERSTGFSRTAVAPDGAYFVTVLYANGIDLTLTDITFHNHNNRLQHYRLSITSNNRGIATPAAEEVTIVLDEQRPDFSKWTPTALSSGSITEGDLTFTPAGTATQVSYNIKRRFGKFELIGFGLGGVRRYIITNLATNKVLRDVEGIAYMHATDIPGVWYAFNYSHLFTDSESGLDYLISMNANRQTLSADGQADFVPTSNLTAIVYPLISPTVTNVRVAHAGKQVAKFTGGPYTCDITDPTGAGDSGTPLTLQWFDEFPEDILPSLTFPCSRAYLYIDPLP